MSDRRPELDDEDDDLGEPVTDTLEVLLEALPDDGSWSGEEEVDLGEPVTDRIKTLLAELPAGASLAPAEADEDWDEPVTDRLAELLRHLPEEEGDRAAAGEPGGPPEAPASPGFWRRVVRALFGR